MTNWSREAEVLIVSHGSPSDPDPQERFIRRVAERVGARTGARVMGATLAKPGSLEAAVAGVTSPDVFPHFMADGWFVSTYLQDRLAETGLADWNTLAPLGLNAELPVVAERRLAAEMNNAGLPKGKTVLIVAAHGSPSNPRPAEATRMFADTLAETDLFESVRVGFVDQEPGLSEAATIEGPAILLPFFAARAGHVLSDLPEAIHMAKFRGAVLPPIGVWDEIPFLIARSLMRAKAT